MYIDGEKLILAKYDEEVKKTFTIGKGEAHASAKVEKPLGRSAHLKEDTFDFSRPVEIVSDYADTSSMKVKKPKKSAKKAINWDALFADIERPTEEVTPISVASKKRTHSEDSGLGDDEELQELQGRSRRRALKKKQVPRVEDIARKIPETPVEEAPFSGEGGLVFDGTTLFVSEIRLPKVETRLSQEESLLLKSERDEMDISKDVAGPEPAMEVGEPMEMDKPNQIVDEEPAQSMMKSSILTAWPQPLPP